jgi:antitoxin ParD1/3/4
MRHSDTPLAGAHQRPACPPLEKIAMIDNHCYFTHHEKRRSSAVNVSLTPQLEALIKKKLKSGLYNSASEVVREALRLLDERDRLKKMKLEEIRKEVLAGVEQLDKGLSKSLDESTAGRIKKRGRKMLRSKKIKKPA